MFKYENVLSRMLIEMIYKIANTGDYILVLNGQIQLEGNNPVYLQTGIDGESGTKFIKFFTKSKAESHRYNNYFDSASTSKYIKQMVSTTLLDVDFSEWCNEHLSGLEAINEINDKVLNAMSGFMSVHKNSKLGCLFVNTVVYESFLNRVLKVSVPSRPPVPDKKYADTFDLGNFSWKLRSREFDNLITLYDRRVRRKIRKGYGVSPFYTSSPGVISMVNYHDSAVYNPLIDDPSIANLISSTKLGTTWNSKKITSQGLTYMFLSMYEICKIFQIPRLVRLEFRMIIRLIQGIVTPTLFGDVHIPNPRYPVMRLNGAFEGYEKFISVDEFNADRDNLRDFYTESNSMNAFLLSNYRYFESQSQEFNRLAKLIDLFEGVGLARD